MASAEEKVELWIDPAARAWVPDPASLDDVQRQRCVVYVAFPQQRLMGKVGGEPPRPVRWRAADEGDVQAAAEGTAQEPRLVPAAPAVGPSGTCPAAPPPGGSARATAAAGGPGETAEAAEEEDDPLMFTANPAGGVVLASSVFERLQHGVSERYADYRYSSERTCAAEFCGEAQGVESPAGLELAEQLPPPWPPPTAAAG